MSEDELVRIKIKDPVRMWLSVRAPVGESIDAVCVAAVDVAKTTGCLVRFEFNGEAVLAEPESIPADLAREWRRRVATECGRCGREGKTYGEGSALSVLDPRTGWCRGACLRG